jgi:hypothetical protein
MFSVLMTMRLWGINPRTWLTAYLEACTASGGQPPASLCAFHPHAHPPDQGHLALSAAQELPLNP